MKKIIFLPVLVFLIFVTVLYGLVPLLSKERGFRNDLQEQTNNLKRINDYILELEGTTKRIEENQRIFANMEKSLSEEFSIPSLLNFFQLTAIENGLLLRSFSYNKQSVDSEGAQVEKDKIKAVLFSLVLEGNVASLVSFIKNLEISSRLFDITLIDFGITKDDSSMTKFNIAVKTYYY